MMNSTKWTCYNENKAPLNISVNTFIGTQDFHYQFYTYLHSMAPSVASNLTHTDYNSSKEYEQSSVSLQGANKIVEQKAPVLIKVALTYKNVTYSGNRVLELGYRYADDKYTFTNPTFTTLKNVCLEIMHNYLPNAVECDTVNMLSFDVMSDAQIDALSKTGTFVYEGGVYQPEWNADTKVSKRTATDEVYYVYGHYKSDDIDISTSVGINPYYLVSRDANGDVLVPDTPTASNAALNKQYVDNGFVAKVNPAENIDVVYTNYYMADGTRRDTYAQIARAAIPYAIVGYTADGDVRVPVEPVSGQGATSKIYVNKNSYAVVTIDFALPDMPYTETVTVAVPRKIGSRVVTYLPTSSAPETICYTNLQFEVALNSENQWEVNTARATWWSTPDSKIEFYEWTTTTKADDPTPTTGEFQYNVTEGA